MKNVPIVMFLVFFTLTGCGNDPQDQKANLNGYWKIQHADTPYQKGKKYKFSENVDYIKVKNDTGFRAKVLPRLDGSVISNGVREQLSLSISQDSLRLNYKTPYDAWQETVIKADGEVLKVKNRRGFIYTYTKYEPKNITQ